MKKFILTESQYKILLKEMSDDISMLDMYKNVLSNPSPKSGTAVTPEKDLGTFDGWKRVRKRGINKMNLKNVETGEYVSQTWYDFVGSMINGIAIVIDNNKGVNAIDVNGELLFRSWHEDINEKKDGEEYIIKDGPRVVVRSREDILNNRSLNESTMQEIDDASKEVDLNPTEPQQEAGNYRMAHISVKGMTISIENPKGSKRYYGEKDADGNRKYSVMKNHYGYFTKSLGKDGDAVDVFIGPNVDNFERVYCVDQKVKGEFDETKVMLGFNSKEEAKEAYLSNYDENWKGFMAITSVPLKTFKKWLYRGRKQRQPFRNYVEIKKKQLKESKEQVNEEFTTAQIKNIVSKLIYSNVPLEEFVNMTVKPETVDIDFVGDYANYVHCNINWVDRCNDEKNEYFKKSLIDVVGESVYCNFVRSFANSFTNYKTISKNMNLNGKEIISLFLSYVKKNKSRITDDYRQIIRWRCVAEKDMRWFLTYQTRQQFGTLDDALFFIENNEKMFPCVSQFGITFYDFVVRFNFAYGCEISDIDDMKKMYNSYRNTMEELDRLFENGEITEEDIEYWDDIMFIVD